MVMPTKNSGNNVPYVNEYIVEKIADLDDIKGAAAGSSALCLEDKNVYFLNSKKEWVKF